MGVWAQTAENFRRSDCAPELMAERVAMVLLSFQIQPLDDGVKIEGMSRDKARNHT